MTRYFSDKQLKDLHLGRRKLGGQLAFLQTRLMSRNFKSESAREYALQGFGRRMGTINRAIDQVFTILPPEREDIPVRDEVVDATIAIQSFVLNIVGCLDNLAWIWVYEENIKTKKGTDLDPKAVGLWKTHKQVRETFPRGFQDYLESRERWFEHIKGFRDALAHRIPLYIPPYVVKPSNADEHDRLEKEAGIALQNMNIEQYDRARFAQRKLAVFQPWMTQSIYEKAPSIVFHPQLLADYATIEELSGKLFDELDRATKPAQ
jgi:hypothetical protein